MLNFENIIQTVNFVNVRSLERKCIKYTKRETACWNLQLHAIVVIIVATAAADIVNDIIILFAFVRYIGQLLVLLLLSLVYYKFTNTH